MKSEIYGKINLIIVLYYLNLKKVFSVLSGQTHYKKYFHKSWREGVRHRAKRLFLGLPRERHYNSFYTPKNV